MKKRNVLLTFFDGIYLKNPVFSLFLGLTLAVICTTSFQSSLYIAGIVLVDMLVVELFIAIFRKHLGKLSSYVIAALLSATISVLATMLLESWYAFIVIDGLSVWTNCIIASFIPFIATTSAVLIKGEQASELDIPHAIADALGSGIGFGIALGIIAFCREWIGTASIQFTIDEESQYLLHSDAWTWTLPVILNPFGGFLLTGFFSGIHACICHSITDRKQKLVGGIE